MFEYGVILNGSQTKGFVHSVAHTFESGVILNGSQTIASGLVLSAMFLALALFVFVFFLINMIVF